jgi:hypothetical protein
MKRILIAMLVLGFSSMTLLAHEGENHDTPTTIKAPKGGVIKALDESRVEVLSKGNSIKVYLYNLEMKPATLSEFKLVAKAQLPRTKKTTDIKLESKDGFFEGLYDPKGVHRYKLILEVSHSKTKQTDRLTFNIEPRK